MNSNAQINPIIPGFAPDPSLVLVGDTYFLVNSTFHLFPGLPIYTSKDLVHWTQIGNAINRTEQLSLAKSATRINFFEDGDHMYATGGLYAPTIRYHEGTFYVVCTNVIRHGDKPSDDELQNFIVSTTDIYKGKWSDPVFFEFNGIDTSLFWDTDGKVYISGSKSPGPMTKVMLFEIDLVTGAKLTEEKELWPGTGGIYPEGPHIYLKNGFYYLMIAEGGTHEGHMVTMARSRSIFGPYEASPENPILTAAGTDEYVQCTGHCEAFEDKNGEWWGVCLAIRKGADLLYGLGRETFLVKGHWTEDGWLKFDRAKTHLSVPGVQVKEEERLTAVPDVDLLYIHDPELSRYTIYSQPKGSPTNYVLTASAHDFHAPEASPTFVGKRQRLMTGTSSVEFKDLKFSTVDKAFTHAGLAVYKDEHRFLRIFIAGETMKVVFEIVNKAKQIERSVEHQLDGKSGDFKLVVSYTEQEYRASVVVGGDKTVELGKVDAMDLSAKDFVGPIIGLFAFADRDGTEDRAREVWFSNFVVDNKAT
ncbi:hypothetical protein E8E13_007126 [Curvularia kusanoi]|uniref:Beta-xylosidase C-terminal Concanavalin A-like domain-containing protein n=1 Tax=Curvularia kusanoi TaxID=90978 RepID=A0A9P4WAR4_CURKU|nr:hypothetical protein E8E13_007126 [Curvularia kusanoi]